jgi:hypothetical protein
MANAMLDSMHAGDSYHRIEEITRHRQRRQWTAEEEVPIVPQSTSVIISREQPAETSAVRYRGRHPL